MYQEQEESPNQQQQIINPTHVEVDGQQIYMAGLDYNLLKQTKANNKKMGLTQLDQIKQKLNIYTDKIKNAHEVILKDKNTQQSSVQSDPTTLKLLRIVKNKYQNAKPNVNINTSYIFDTKYHFGELTPQTIVRKNSRALHMPKYYHLPEQVISKFKELLQEQDQQNANQQKEDPQNSVEDDDDDIFDEPKEQKTNNKNAIEVGKKLDFGVQQLDYLENYKRKPEETVEEVSGKYDFLRKKVKTSKQEIEGYDQCYFQTGPSLDDLVQARKQGIQLFGDAKQFKQKQRKINISKDYEKIKKIIDEKSKKK